MRKIVVGEFISLDGVAEAPDTWHFPYVNEEMYGAMWAINDRCDTMLLGRVTYESFAGAFAHADPDDPVAAKMNKPTKVVVSSTLTEPLEWANSIVLTGDVVEGVARLKEQPGADIVITGSLRLVRSLLRAGLVDELSLLQHPILVGHGQRLFEDDTDATRLQLVSSTAFSTGVLNLLYQKA